MNGGETIFDRIDEELRIFVALLNGKTLTSSLSRLRLLTCDRARAKAQAFFTAHGIERKLSRPRRVMTDVRNR